MTLVAPTWTPMIRLDSISKQNGQQLLFIEASAALGVDAEYRAKIAAMRASGQNAVRLPGIDLPQSLRLSDAPDSFTTARRIIFPLLKPAITTALVYSFVRSITSISAVIFLVSAKYDMATSYIIGLVENGQYGTAIAYASMLIVVMLSCVLGVQKLVGTRRLRRQDRVLNDLRTPPVLQKETV